MKSLCFTLAAALFATTRLGAATPALTPDIPPTFAPPTELCDYEKRVVMIPMRDGVKLHTIIVVPRGAQDAPILLKRTPYQAAKRTSRTESTSMLGILPEGEDVFVHGGYICVWQDVRGKYGSEGDYVMTRPARGPLNDSGIDHTTDAWDTIEWLVGNVPESNGRVGMIGSSYEGFTAAMALLDPHPALKVAAPESPMVDGWMGDDWFHYGAFRQAPFDYFTYATSVKGAGDNILRRGYDDYENFLEAGSAGDFARAAGLDQLPWWRKLTEHPAYDEYWREQAVDRLLATKPLRVPTLWLQGLWDQEDNWGAVHAYPAVEPQDTDNDRNFLVLGPWRHSQVNADGSTLGPLHFGVDTALEFRRDILRPFFDQYLKPGAPRADTPPVLVYNTGEKRWQRFQSWPVTADPEWATDQPDLYLQPGFRLGFASPANPAGEPGYDEYTSDPAKPVPYLPRPIRFADRAAWQRWLVMDQRPYSDRPDVLTYLTEPLREPLQIGGAPLVHLVAATSGTDSDWVVKLIDVFPPDHPAQPELGGYQLGIAMDIFRGRYRESFEHPQPLTPYEPLPYTFALPHACHTFLPGHRIAVQIQSSWFPLYDRNPQTYVGNIFFAQRGDYVKATQRIYRQPAAATRIELPVLRRR